MLAVQGTSIQSQDNGFHCGSHPMHMLLQKLISHRVHRSTNAGGQNKTAMGSKRPKTKKILARKIRKS